MITRSQAVTDVLTLPHIKYLSLKNCWISPHIMARFCVSFKGQNLERLSLNSVSLTADIPLNTTPAPALAGGPNAQQALANWMHQFGQNQAALAAHAVGNAGALPPPIPLPLPPGFAPHHAIAQVHAANAAAAAAALHHPHNHAAQVAAVAAAAAAAAAAQAAGPQDWLEARSGSWATIIELLTPNEAQSMEYRRQIDRDPYFQPSGQKPSGLPTSVLEFKSCGYVRLQLDFDQTALDPVELPTPQPAATLKRVTDIESYMLKPQDHYLGEIVNHVNATEVRQLQSVFVMQFGWDGLEEPYGSMAAEATVDGIAKPGEGRFSGTLRQDPMPLKGN
jgi:hypothetical protein